MTKDLVVQLHEQFRDYLQTFKLPDKAINLALERMTTVHLKEGEIFTSRGKICDKIGLLFNGLLYASFEPDNTEDEKVSRFFYLPDNMIVTSFESFSMGVPANESIIAIRESFLICLSRKDLYYLYDTCPEMNYVGRRLAEQSYIQAQQRNHFLQTFSARERVSEFYKKHPDLFREVQRQQMASYLNMNRNLFTKYFNEC